MQPPQMDDILSRILTIIDYKDNKEAFIQEFLQLAQEQVFLDLVDALPENPRKTLVQQLSSTKSPQTQEEVIKSYFSSQEYATMAIQSWQKFFSDYIKSIEPTLSLMQKQQIHEYLQNIAQQYSKAAPHR